MSAVQPITPGESSVLLLPAARRARRPVRASRIAAAGAIFVLSLLGVVGSLADSALARTSLLLVDPPYPVSVDNVTATLLWAIITNLAFCAGVVMVAYWLLSWPSAQTVELRSQRPSSKP